MCVFVSQGFYKGGKFVFSFKVRNTWRHLETPGVLLSHTVHTQYTNSTQYTHSGVHGL